MSPKNVMISLLTPDGKLTGKYKIADKELLKGYQTMVLSRLLEKQMVTLQRQGTISFAMSGLGEEASIVASAAACKKEDWLFPQYRETGIMFWRDYPLQDYIHHMFCNGKDVNHGRQMPNHFGSKELNVVTVASPLATQLPQAAGCAHAMRLQKEASIALTYFGEGTTSKEDFHVALNFAALKKAPVIFFCRNNQYAISTPAHEQFTAESVAAMGHAHAITSVQVDGNDYFAVHKVVSDARKSCLKNEGPVLIEAMTYRRGAHSTSDDPSAYRKDAEVKEWEKKDPIDRLFKYLVKEKLWSKKQDTELYKTTEQEIADCIDIAKNTEAPSLQSVIQDVTFETSPELKKQLKESALVYGEEV